MEVSEGASLIFGRLPSNQTGRAKTIIAAAQGIGGGATNDDMIEQGDVNGAGGFAQLSRHLEVRSAGRGIPGYTKF